MLIVSVRWKERRGLHLTKVSQMVRNWSTPMNRRNTRSSRSTSTERVTCKRKSEGGARAAAVRAGGAGTEWQRIGSGGIPTEGVRSEGTAVSGRAQECLAIQHNGSPATGPPRPPIHAGPQTVWRVLVCVRVHQGHRSAARIRSGAEVGGAVRRCAADGCVRALCTCTRAARPLHLRVCVDVRVEGRHVELHLLEPLESR
jgi:hypothetical protein